MEKVERGFEQLHSVQRRSRNDMLSVLQQPAAPEVDGQAAAAAEAEERSRSEAEERKAEELARNLAEKRRAKVCRRIFHGPQT